MAKMSQYAHLLHSSRRSCSPISSNTFWMEDVEVILELQDEYKWTSVQRSRRSRRTTVFA